MKYLFLFLLFFTIHGEGGSVKIEKKISDFSKAYFYTPEEVKILREKGNMKFLKRREGALEYEIDIPETAWYGLYVSAGPKADIYVDGEFLIYTGFNSTGIWEKKDGCEKIVNLYLKKGKHYIKFSRTWFPGLFIQKFFLEKSEDITGMVRLSLIKDYLAFRKNESFPVRFICGKLNNTYHAKIEIYDVLAEKIYKKIEFEIPEGKGLYTEEINLPTDKEGIFDIRIKDESGRFLDRIVQYIVIDTEKEIKSEPLEKVLVQEIDCAKVKPDFQNGETKVINSPIGSYRESGDKGNIEYRINASWFAYKLNLPEIQVPYLLEIYYPDDDERTFTYALIEKDAPGCRSLCHGVASGGMYPLSYKMQKAEMIFFPRQKDPRLQFRTWWSRQRAAVSKIKIYKITSGFPCITEKSERKFGLYQEEPLRFTTHWGAMPEGNRWATLWACGERVGKVSKYVGINLWRPTIAIYGAKLWPGKYLPSLEMADESGFSILGPSTTKEPVKKDIIRFMLLISEKYGLDYVGELFMPAGRPVAREYFEDRFGGDGNIDYDNPEVLQRKPWLIVDKNGKSPGTPLYNPVYPGIQQWVADIVKELAERYKDFPSFKGVAIRFMGWQFYSWQGFPSIKWGYGDYTISLFEKETGIKIPVDKNDPERFKKRYEFLVSKHYDEWIKWRCEKMYQYYKKLANILSETRKDLKLYLDLYGPNYAEDYTISDWDRKGWDGLLKESGIDPTIYKNEKNIVLKPQKHYPPGIRGTRTKDPEIRAFLITKFYDSTNIEKTSKKTEKGISNYLHFDANSFESNIARAKDLGLGDYFTFRRSREIHGAGLVFPAGRNYFERYADAMAEGNIIEMDDGSHGYSLGIPFYMREFLKEYHCLPAIGMKKLKGSGDPVALWYGEKGRKLYFYIVNRAYYPVEIKVKFKRKARIERLTEGKTTKKKELNLKLRPYQLMTFCVPDGIAPSGLDVKVPEKIKKELKKQIDFVKNLIYGGGENETKIISLSPVDIKKAERKYREAEKYFKNGEFVRARRTLFHHHLVKLYSAFTSWPPNLWQKKIAPVPENALGPEILLKISAEKNKLSVIPASCIDKRFAGENVLLSSRGEIPLKIKIPVSNKYMVSYCILKKENYTEPEISIGNKRLVEFSKEEGNGWVKKFFSPVSLKKGQHNLKIRVKNKVALFYIDISPVYTCLTSDKWFVIGPFPSRIEGWKGPGKGIDEVFPPEKERDFKKKYEFEGKKLDWIRPHFKSEYVDIYELTGSLKFEISYAVLYLNCPEDREAEILFGVDYWGKIWVNGKKVFELKEGHGAPVKNQFKIPVKLKKGRNEILVKIHSGSRGNGFWMSISNPDDISIK